MRVILAGPEAERDRLRWGLEGTGVTVVGEFPTVAEARDSGVTADAVIVPARPSDAPRRRPPAGDDDGRSGRHGTGPPLPADALTPREIDVLELLAEGLPNKAIAARLAISDQTVKFHVASITGKLGVANRTEAVRQAIRRGLIAV